jgi:hypothetical protein
MSRSWLQKIKFTIEAIFVVIIVGLFFELTLQPILVGIDPMFADQNLPVGETTGRGPETPAEAALYATIFIGCIVYYLVKGEIKDYISGRN